MTKLGIIGSRDVDRDTVWHILKGNITNDTVVLAGGARGVDQLAEEFAGSIGATFILFKPYFLLDPSAGYSVRHYFTRNKQIIDNADVVLAIWNGDSPGTKWGINYARKKKKTLIVYNLKETTNDQD